MPPSSVAPAVAELAGGVDRLAERANEFVRDARPLEALHVLEIALAADPGARRARDVKREALALLLAQTGGKNLWERMWIASELRALEARPAE